MVRCMWIAGCCALAFGACTDPDLGSTHWRCDSQQVCSSDMICLHGYCMPLSCLDVNCFPDDFFEVGEDGDGEADIEPDAEPDAADRG